MAFFPTTPTEEWSTYGAMGGTALIWILWRPRLYPVYLRATGNTELDLKLIEWERDGVLTLAKGMAAAAAIYFTAVIPLLFKGEISASVPRFALLGTIAGFVGLLLMSCDMVITTRRWARSPFLPELRRVS